MKNKGYRVLFEICLHLTLFFMVLELASATSYGALESSLAMLCVSFLALLLADWGLHPFEILRELTLPFCQCPFLMVTVAVYVAVDAMTLFYSPLLTTALQKYKAELLMIFFFFVLAYYIQEPKQIDRIFQNITFTGGLCALLSILNLSVLHLFERQYFLRLSLRTDYNMFAAVLFTSLLTGTFLLLRAKWKNRQKLFLLTLWWGCMGSVIYLSSSRRTWLLTPWCGIFLLGLIIIFRRKLFPKVKVVQLGAAVLGICLTGLIAVPCLEQYMEAAYEKSLVHTGESSAAQRYESLLEGRESKRLIIWQTAWEEYKGFSLWEKWTGKGAAYDILLYDQTNFPPLRQAYPDFEKVRGKLSAHNFLLADLLNGGLIKFVAGTAVWTAAAWTLLCRLRKSPCFGWLYVMELGYVFLNSSISNRYGFLYDKFFWIFLALLCLEIHLEEQGRRREIP